MSVNGRIFLLVFFDTYISIDGSFFVPVLNFYITSSTDKSEEALYCYSVWNVFKDRLLSSFEHRGVPCRKRVQRYSFFLYYQTFSKEIFKDFFRKINKALNNTTLTTKKNFNDFEQFLLLLVKHSKNRRFFLGRFVFIKLFFSDFERNSLNLHSKVCENRQHLSKITKKKSQKV